MSEHKDCVNCVYWDDDYGCMCDRDDNCIYADDDDDCGEDV